MSGFIRISKVEKFVKTKSLLRRLSKFDAEDIFRKYGERGVDVLRTHTPKRTGKTASSWSYEIEKHKGGFSIIWKNSNINQGECIAILIQYGHGTRNGGYVKGIDYINPALKPVMQNLADEVFKEVSQT